MSNITPKVLSFVLLGIYLLSLYPQTKFKGYIRLSIACFFIATLKLLILEALVVQILIAMLILIITLVLSRGELKSFEESGIDILQPNKRNIIFAIFLGFVYVISKILFFNEQ